MTDLSGATSVVSHADNEEISKESFISTRASAAASVAVAAASAVGGKAKSLAANIAKKYKVLCIDEFEVKDITDAMLIIHLFKYYIT